MKLKRYKDFLQIFESDFNIDTLYDVPESNEPWIFVSHFNCQPEMVTNGKFNRRMPDEVKGRFDCSFMNLTTLEGCPKIIGGDFSCDVNQLKNLEYAPSIVKGSFFCEKNQLTSLKGCPKHIGEIFSCSFNKLTSLEYGPISVRSVIDHEKNLEELGWEADFILYGRHKDKSTYGKTNDQSYWIDLLKYMIEQKNELHWVKGWPKGFLTDELIASVSGITKFNL